MESYFVKFRRVLQKNIETQISDKASILLDGHYTHETSADRIGIEVVRSVGYVQALRWVLDEIKNVEDDMTHNG